MDNESEQPNKNVDIIEEFEYKLELVNGKGDGKVIYNHTLPAAIKVNGELYELYQEKRIWDGMETITDNEGNIEEDFLWDDEDFIHSDEDCTYEFTRMSCVYKYKLVER
jgi:hypothetical protein